MSAPSGSTMERMPNLRSRSATRVLRYLRGRGLLDELDAWTRSATPPVQLSREAPVAAFDGDFVNVGGRSYDVATDGSFLIIDGGSGVTTTLNVIPDFFDFLRERVGR